MEPYHFDLQFHKHDSYILIDQSFTLYIISKSFLVHTYNIMFILIMVYIEFNIQWELKKYYNIYFSIQ